MITSVLRVLLTRSFKPLVFNNKTVEDLDFDVDEFGIYVHIPFCTTLCSFCPYYKVKYDKALVESYKEALLKEITRAGTVHKNKSITSVYFGGGTPALMIEELQEIISTLKESFKIEGNIGVELHPRDINEALLEKLKNISFDMISVGIQSFQESCLNTLGREYIDGESKVKLVSDFGFKVIDVDLIFGMAKQTKEDLSKDFITAFNAGATQVSTYPFIDFSYANNKHKPLGRRDKKELLNCLDEASNNIECNRTSVWTFGKKHTPKYSSITRDLYIGFGPSAATLTKKAFGVNTFSVEEYIKLIENGDCARALTMNFDSRTRKIYWLFWNAYTLKLNNNGFYKLFNESLDKAFGIELKLGRFLGLVKKITDGYELTKRGAYIYHLLEQKYTHQYIDKTWRQAGATPPPEEIKLY